MTSQILDKLLNNGIVVHGEVKIEGLTVTSISRAKSLGILPDDSDFGSYPEEETNSHLEPKHDVLNSEIVSREEFNLMTEEIRSVRQLLLDLKKRKKR